jgi:hypothetical protein
VRQRDSWLYDRLVPTRASSFIRTAGIEGILLKRLLLPVDDVLGEGGSEA